MLVDTVLKAAVTAWVNAPLCTMSVHNIKVWQHALISSVFFVWDHFWEMGKWGRTMICNGDALFTLLHHFTWQDLWTEFYSCSCNQLGLLLPPFYNKSLGLVGSILMAGWLSKVLAHNELIVMIVFASDSFECVIQSNTTTYHGYLSGRYSEFEWARIIDERLLWRHIHGQESPSYFGG